MSHYQSVGVPVSEQAAGQADMRHTTPYTAVICNNIYNDQDDYLDTYHLV
jgi:hypothetical protein